MLKSAMLKKIVLACVVGALALSVMPANAKVLKRQKVTFSADPCAIACPYILYPDAVGDPVAVDPLTVDPVDVAFDTFLPPDESWCTDGVLGHVDQLTVKAPKRAGLLIFEAWPEVDWDIAVCRKTKKGLKFLAYGANTIGGGLTDEEDALCAIGVGCYERIQISVKGGKRYVLRAFNWSDPSDLPARYRFFR